MQAIADNTRKYYWTGTIVMKNKKQYSFGNEDIVKGSGYITGLLNQIEAGKIVVYNFVNATPFVIGSSNTEVMAITFTSKEETTATFLAEVLFEVINDEVEETVNGTVTEEEETEEGETIPVTKEVAFTHTKIGESELTVTYKMNDEEIKTFYPKKTCINGKHILTLFLPITQVIENSENPLSVFFKMSDGTMTIGESQIRATSSANDQRAVTIECASDKTEPYAMNDAVYSTLIKLCMDICKRNGKKKLLWLGDKDKTLNYSPASDEMVLTVHRWFANKSCPGNWLYARLGDLAAKVTAALGGSSSTTGTSTEMYRVRKTWADTKSQLGAYKELANAKACVDEHPGYSVFDVNGVNIYTSNTTSSAAPFKAKVAISDLNIRKGPGTNYARTQYIPIGVYTIVEVQSGTGSDKGWGRLKSGAGWISWLLHQGFSIS